MAQCLHCRGQMFTRRYVLGVKLQSGICPACEDAGVKWRDLDTVQLIGQHGDKPSHVYAMKVLAGVDPPDLPAHAIGLAQREYWRFAGRYVANWLACRDVPPAREEGPRRV